MLPEIDFYIVWRPDGTNPKMIHETFDSAKTEAMRLAKNELGKRFYVLKSKGLAVDLGATWIESKEAKNDKIDEYTSGYFDIDYAADEISESEIDIA